MKLLIRDNSSFGTEFFWQFVENVLVKLFFGKILLFVSDGNFVQLFNKWIGIQTFFTKLSISFFKYSFIFCFVTPFSSSGTALRMSSVKRVRWGEYVTLFSSRNLAQSFSNTLASESIPLTYVSLIHVITLLKQTAIQYLLTSFDRDTSRLDSASAFCLYLFSVYTFSRSIYNKICDIHYVRYNISIRQFSKNRLVVQRNCDCFYFFCCFLDMLFVYSSFTGMHPPAAQIFVFGLLQIKHTISPKGKETRLDRFEDVGKSKLSWFTRFFHRRKGKSMKMILVILSVAFFVICNNPLSQNFSSISASVSRPAVVPRSFSFFFVF